MIGVGHLFHRNAVRDDLAGFDATGLDVLDQSGQVALHRALVHAQRQPLVHGVADGHRVEGGTVDAHDRHRAALAHRVDAPVQHRRRAAL